MPCCAKTMSMEEISKGAVDAGFDASWIADLVEKYGHDVVAMVVEAVRNGFSVSFVVEILGKFGPVVLQMLMNLLSGLQAKGVVATNSVAIDVLLLEQLLKLYGDKLLQMLLGWVSTLEKV